MKDHRVFGHRVSSSSPQGCDVESSGRFGRVSFLGSHSRVASWAAEEVLHVDKLCRF